MHQQGVFVGFKAAQHGVHGVAPVAEHGFHLLLDAPGVLDGRCRVAMEPGAAPVHAAAREVVSDEQQHPPPFTHAALHIPGQHLAQVRPTQVEHAPRLRNGWMMPSGVCVATGMLMRPSMHLSTPMAVGCSAR